ncbi:phosphomevalonate kinase [Lactobacillus psittaci]|uniref:phosphomevalonate kinase n=1 Tax=Lactobacillus psittaci DSM 15354 TaxID=1122152 RepID=A0A0R1SC32_9LACO|nr:phosphomevalonate kinase [Lactobacillus psittaci]KRL63635.1 phosphomevalonate kinase [Lactobacillus psittaci DSM 15354]
MIIEKAPGKLYIAGEYAVLEQNCPAIIVALDQFVTATIFPAHGMTGVIHSKQYSQNSIHWRRSGNKMVIDNRDNPFEYIISAIRFTEQYLVENGIKLKIFDLHIDSDLDSKDGKKYGLGSSAAVTVATVKAILYFYGIELNKDLIFKLAAISHYNVQGNGSAGDIAASVYGGWLAYQTFDKKWLKAQLSHQKLSKIIEQAWPGLLVQVLTPPAGMDLLIGWSGQPASTSQLVDKTDAHKEDIKKEYQHFLNDSRACVLAMIKGFKENDINQIQNEIRRNRKILANFAKLNHIAIEIPRLTKLIEIAESFGFAAKTSGAGNGDCGIVITNHAQRESLLKMEWREAGIIPLDFQVHTLSN